MLVMLAILYWYILIYIYILCIEHFSCLQRWELKHPPKNYSLFTFFCPIFLELLGWNLLHGNSMATLSRILNLKLAVLEAAPHGFHGWKMVETTVGVIEVEVMCHEVGCSLVKTKRSVSITCRKESPARHGAKSVFVFELFTYAGARFHKHNQEILIIDFKTESTKYSSRVEQTIYREFLADDILYKSWQYI